MFRILVAALLAAASLAAQRFEVASIKPSDPGAHGMSLLIHPGGRFTTTNATLRALVTFAYDVRDHQLSGGPNWLNTEHYDIVARPAGFVENTQQKVPADHVRVMVRALLTERFALAIHRETRESPVYFLVVAKGGPKMRESTPESNGPGIHGSGDGITCTKIDMEFFAKSMSTRVFRTVIDKTGLAASYDFELHWTPDIDQLPREGEKPEAAAASDGPSIFTAVQEQLGLKLEPGKGPVEFLIIDHAEKPSDN